MSTSLWEDSSTDDVPVTSKRWRTSLTQTDLVSVSAPPILTLGSASKHQSPSKLYVDRSYGSSSTRQSITTKSRAGSKRLSVLTSFSMDSEPSLLRQSSYDDRTENGHAIAYSERPADSIRALSLSQMEKSRMMLRTTSDGADVILDDGALEWTVVNPHGVFKGQKPVSEERLARKRRSVRVPQVESELMGHQQLAPRSAALPQRHCIACVSRTGAC